MGSVRSRKETGLLFLDFRYQGQRCREQTLLPDTPANRKRLEKLLLGIEQEIKQGTFDYAKAFPTSSRVQELEAQSLHQMSSPIVAAPFKRELPVNTATPSFRTFVEQWVLEHQIEWRRSHLRTLQSTIDNHLIRYFQDKPIGDITREDIMAFRNQLASLPGRSGKSTLSNKRINGILGPLRRILEDAADRYGFTNPLANYKPLKIRKTDVHPFSLTEVQKLLAVCRPDFKDYLVIRIFTGMRTGEAHGLKWKYVDFERRQVLIRETQVLGEDEYTKTDSSQRDIQMSQPVFEALMRMHAATAHLSEYVFCNRQGKPLDNKNFTDRVWYPLLRHAGMEMRRPYQMRHTAATLWLASGESPEWIARQLGHGSTEMLFRVYSRYVPNITRQDGSAIDRLLSSRFASGDINLSAPPSDHDRRAAPSHPSTTASRTNRHQDGHGPPFFVAQGGFKTNSFAATHTAI